MERKSGLARWFYLSAGFLCVGLGLAGAVLPVLPTTPFMLVALFCFARSSKRFHDWLYHHRWFGPPLQRWRRHGVIPLRAKVFSVAAMLGSLTYLVGWSPAPPYVIWIAAGVMAYGAWFILSRPSLPPAEITKDTNQPPPL